MGTLYDQNRWSPRADRTWILGVRRRTPSCAILFVSWIHAYPPRNSPRNYPRDPPPGIPPRIIPCIPSIDPPSPTPPLPPPGIPPKIHPQGSPQRDSPKGLVAILGRFRFLRSTMDPPRDQSPHESPREGSVPRTAGVPRQILRRSWGTDVHTLICYFICFGIVRSLVQHDDCQQDPVKDAAVGWTVCPALYLNGDRGPIAVISPEGHAAGEHTMIHDSQDDPI